MYAYGDRQAQSDHTMFIKHSPQGQIISFCLGQWYILLTGDDPEEVQRLKEYLASELEIKDFGDLSIFQRLKQQNPSKMYLYFSTNMFLISQKKQECLAKRPVIP